MPLITRLLRAWDALLGHDPAAPIVGLPPEQLRRLGALTLQEDRSEAVEQHVTLQRHAYEGATKAQLIETLIARDRELMEQGKRLADGTIGGRVLKETMRAALYHADGQVARVEEILTNMMGAEPSDRRALGRHGSMLGQIDTPEGKE